MRSPGCSPSATSPAAKASTCSASSRPGPVGCPAGGRSAPGRSAEAGNGAVEMHPDRVADHRLVGGAMHIAGRGFGHWRLPGTICVNAIMRYAHGLHNGSDGPIKGRPGDRTTCLSAASRAIRTVARRRPIASAAPMCPGVVLNGHGHLIGRISPPADIGWLCKFRWRRSFTLCGRLS